MAFLSFQNIKLCGISACVPKQVERNEDYDWITEQERQSLIKNTGVSERRIAPAIVCTSDLCFTAAEKLISDLGWVKDDIEALIFVSQSGDYFLPATSVILQDRLGLSKNCMALDISLGCSGYVYGLSVISSLMSTGNLKKAILLCGDKSSLSAYRNDKSTYPLFGDAGTATAIEYDVLAKNTFFNLQSDGHGFQSIIITDGVCRNPMQASSLVAQAIDRGIERNGLSLILNGTAIFDFTLREVIPNINMTLSKCETNIGEIDYFVLHQANLLINETLRQKMKIPAEKVPYSIHKFGNTSSASIPLTIVTQLQSKVREKPLKILLSGFGVGLSWGSAIINTDKIVCPDLIEYNE